MLDIKGSELAVDDKVMYATTHGNLQFGRIMEIGEDTIQVLGVGNKRELRIKDTTKQVYLISSGHYIRNPSYKA